MRNNFNDLENIIYSKIKYGLSNDLKDEYPDLEIGTSTINESDETFPYIYVHLLPCNEIGTDLELNTIDTVVATVQIEVTDNKSQRNTSAVMKEITEIFKQMHFRATQLPYNENLKNYRSVCRFQRNICATDVL